MMRERSTRWIKRGFRRFGMRGWVIRGWWTIISGRGVRPYIHFLTENRMIRYKFLLEESVPVHLFVYRRAETGVGKGRRLGWESLL